MAHPDSVDEGGEEHHGSPWPVVIAVGMGIGYVGIVSASIPILVVGAAVFAAGAGGWVHVDMERPSRAFYGLAAAIESRFPRVSARKLALWLFLVTEIMFFSAIIGASWTLRLRTTTPGAAFQAPWARPGEILNVPLTGLNTFILICSSLTMVEVLAAIERGDQRKVRYFLLATLLLGITFLSIQAFEYQKLYFGEGLTFTQVPAHASEVNKLYGPTFYAQTGVHGSHVTAGVLALAYATRRAFKGGFTKENHEAVELVGLYWHFVDVVWIFLFTIVYLI
jgi:heme/copper-type cytochrome/quinol oxidase subunit 3